MSDTITAKGEVMRVLTNSAGSWLAVHEIREAGINAYSENCLATRLPELALDGKVVSRVREGKRFKEWSIAEIAHD